MTDTTTPPLVFNGIVEVSSKLLLILHAFSPEKLSFKELRVLEYFVVFGEDAGLPTNIHPANANRARSYHVRLQTFRQALAALESLGEVRFTEEGYQIIDEMRSAGRKVESEHLIDIWNCARELKVKMDAVGREEFFKSLRSTLAELLPIPLTFPDDGAEKFKFLLKQYDSDIKRCGGIFEMATLFLHTYLNTRMSYALPNEAKTAYKQDIEPLFELFRATRTASEDEMNTTTSSRADLVDMLRSDPEFEGIHIG